MLKKLMSVGLFYCAERNFFPFRYNSALVIFITSNILAEADTFTRRSLSADLIEFLMSYRSTISAPVFANIRQRTQSLY